MLSFRHRFFNCILSCIPNTPRKSEENLPLLLLLEKTFPSQAQHCDVEILKRLSVRCFGRSTRPAERRGDETTLQKYILGESPQ